MTKVKICGITDLNDALAAADAGADLIGLNFYRPSPRYIDPAAAGRISAGLRDALGERRPLIVGVFVNEPVDSLEAIAAEAGLDLIQLHGDEPPEVLAACGGRAFKALRPSSLAGVLAQMRLYLSHLPDDPRAPSLLLDAFHPNLYGGTGEQASAEVTWAVSQHVPRLMLAGGLTPENVAERVRWFQPWGVDVASGVENGTPGRKDIGKMRAFVEAVRLCSGHAGHD